MRIYQNCVEMINEVTRDLFARGIVSFDPTVQAIDVRLHRDRYEMKELVGYAYTLLDGSDKAKMIEWARKNFKECDITVEWAEAWFKDRISGEALNPEPSYKLRETYWNRYLQPNGKFSYTYSGRMAIWLENVIGLLKLNPYRRGACLSIWDGVTDIVHLARHERTPCSMYYQFLIRPILEQDTLAIIYTMRSCDLIKHFPSDVYCAIRLGEYVSEEVGVEFGGLIHFIGSLHAYKKDVDPSRQW